MKDLESSYLYFFSLLHVIALLFGFEVVQFGTYFSAVFLVIILGMGTFIATWTKNKYLCLGMALIYTVGWVVEFTEISQWVIPWRHEQYLLLACMDALAATLLIKRSEI